MQPADWQPIEETVPAAITALAQQREQARGQKGWGDADALRKQIAEAGYEIEDTPQGSKVRVKR